MKTKHYHIVLHPTEIKWNARFPSETIRVHFPSQHHPDSDEFASDLRERINNRWDRELSRQWEGYREGDLFVETGREPVSIMHPAYSEGHRTTPIYKLIKKGGEINHA